MSENNRIQMCHECDTVHDLLSSCDPMDRIANLESQLKTAKERVGELENKLAKIHNLCSESELHRAECECLTCQVFSLSSAPAHPKPVEESSTFLPDCLKRTAKAKCDNPYNFRFAGPCSKQCAKPVTEEGKD